MPFTTMTLEQLARHIGMDAREVRRMAEKGQLPGQMIRGEWRFHHAEMLDWLQREMHTLGAADLRNLERAMRDGSDAVFRTMLSPHGIDMNLPARSRPSVLRELVKLAERTGLVYDSAGLIEALEAREALCATALPGGLALPHPRTVMPWATAEPMLCLARVPAGVPLGAPDGRLTDLFVLIIAHEERQHLMTLARLSLMFQSDLADRLREIDDSSEALDVILAREEELLTGK
ncbi:MAG: PTS sugar transporter subunit IIA [Phycisphaerales bacterium]|nr:PTS sugar transporter subunit IIA [Phycisphaerales bacterium]